MPSKIKDDGRSAFPYQHFGSPPSRAEYGMTYRQWLAGMALAGTMAAEWAVEQTVEQTAVTCVRVTDALLAELDKEDKTDG